MRPLVDTNNARRRCSLGLAIFAASLLTSCGKGSQGVPGLEGFQAGVIRSRLYVSFLATATNWDVGLTMPIPGLTDATVSLAPNLNGKGTVFQFALGLESLLRSGKAFPLSGLPDGRPIPGINSGALPRWDFPVRNINMSVYLSDDAFALFVPLKLISSKGIPLPLMIAVTIEDDRGNRLGKAYAVPSDVSGSGSGVLVLLPFLGSTPGQTLN